jgi:NAD(P)-dependent dehydrogenase (short-subunit alcohol dehydrogenase family)
MLLKDKIGLVTGSTSNIGLEIARTFAREGATVIVNSRHQDEAKKVAAEIGGDYFQADLARGDEIEAMFNHIKNKHKGIDILVNCVAHSPKNGLLETSLKEWNEVLAVNLNSYFLCTQHAARIMKERGGGAIINISAASGERGSPGAAAYAVSKGGVNALTRQASADLAPYKIRVNCIISGVVGTPVGRRDMGNRMPEYDAIPLRRIGQPADIAEAAAFLASEKASYITNAFLVVDGGRMNSMASASRG